jgi:inosine triphosphate pyrophosphatase
MTLIFVTSNKNKLHEAEHILGMRLTQHKIRTVEIQGTDEEIAIDKARKALEQLNAPLIVEDTSLSFHALGGLPGPYIDEWQKKIGNEGLLRLLEGFPDKRATASCIVAFATPGKEPILFKGSVDGTIVPPRGTGFGWDPIFDIEGKTYGEMTMKEKARGSFRTAALLKLKAKINTLQ